MTGIIPLQCFTLKLLQDCIAVLSFCFALFFLIVIVYRRYFHPLSHFPGPFLAVASNLHQCYRYLRGNEHEYYLMLHNKYGPIVRFGPNSLMVNKPEFLPTIYHRTADKTEFYNPNFGTISLFSTLKHENHVIIKRRLGAAYALSAVKRYETRIDTIVIEMLNGLSEAWESANLDNWLHWFAYDVISSVIAGKPIGFLKERNDVRGLIASFAQVVWPLEFLGRVPKLSFLARKTWLGQKFFEAKAGDTNGIGALMAERDVWYHDHMKQPCPGSSEHGDLMYQFMASKSHDKSSAMTEYDVKAEVLLAMLGGSATVSDALQKLFRNLLAQPQCLKLLTSEIDNASSSGQIKSPASFASLQTLPYLSATVRESFRFSPSTPLLPRVVPNGGVVFNGQLIPAGIALASSPWITMRDCGVYGDDAAVFRPERWLEVEPETKRIWDRWDFHWGFGNRTCLGKHIATIEIFKCVFEVRLLLLVYAVCFRALSQAC
ncbi:cytochrome P450 [Tothia fuscella]|uniref:Cytochrome P450 n=1 Tax=Tothia fuscella TaxID=1048955 RepID=A0A9P4TU53_9PEZI|nr:cytochrome P450 [Tothia fuscella]